MKATKDQLPELCNDDAVQQFEKIVRGIHFQYGFEEVIETPVTEVWWKRGRPGIVKRAVKKLFPARSKIESK